MGSPLDKIQWGIGYGINLALQPGLTIADIDLFLS